MVYSATQFRKQSAENQDAVEKRIDAALADAASKGLGGGVAIAISQFRSLPLSDVAWHALLDRYRAAGWEAVYRSDQRDGDFLMFTLP